MTASPRFGDKSLLITVCFGVGYGWDIERIIDNYEIRHFIIIEPNARNLNLSLFFIDYISLYHRFMARGGRHFTFLTYDPKKKEDAAAPENAEAAPPATDKGEGEGEEKNSSFLDERNKALATDLRQTIRLFWLPYMAGRCLHFNDYRSEDVREIWTALGHEFFLPTWAGDSSTTRCCRSSTPPRTSTPATPCAPRWPRACLRDVVAFVIGSGPSLDELLPIIEAHKDRAVIISCGTALTVLARKGIKPDFHVEIERTDLTYEFMADPKHRDFVRTFPCS